MNRLLFCLRLTPGPLAPAFPAAAAAGGVDEKEGATKPRPTPPGCPASSLAGATQCQAQHNEQQDISARDRTSDPGRRQCARSKTRRLVAARTAHRLN